MKKATLFIVSIFIMAQLMAQHSRAYRGPIVDMHQHTWQKKNSHISTDSFSSDSVIFPHELVDFTPYEKNPVFTGSAVPAWDRFIRERGWILREGKNYFLWYTGYREDINEEKHLGYATSTDGLTWTKFKDNPVYNLGWVEDMTVIKSGGTYYMFAEGRDDIAHLLTSKDRIHWKEEGPLDIRYVDGKPLSKGPYGTPAVLVENGMWYLFYERDDLGIWLAKSRDRKVWTNVQDDPVMKMGPEVYDQFGVAFDQVIRYKGEYYAYYHATEFKDWHEWTSCIASSTDLIHWKKYPLNPILRENKSSPVLIYDGVQYRLYTMHPEVNVHFSRTPASKK